MRACLWSVKLLLTKMSDAADLEEVCDLESRDTYNG